MKIRTDFVTNSSSSSFILARSSQLNNKQKEEIIKYVERELLGEPVLTPQSTEEEISDVFEEESWEYLNEDEQQQIKQSLAEGKTIYRGVLDYDECENCYAALFKQLWKVMEKNGEDNFRAIKDDLSY